MALLDTGGLFHKLVTDVMAPLGGQVANELFPESIERLPFVVHRSWGQRMLNNNLLWLVTLTLTVYTNDTDSFDVCNVLDDALLGWVEPGSNTGFVPNLGSITSLEQEFQALAPMTAAEDASMSNKAVHQSTGSWQFVVRQLT